MTKTYDVLYGPYGADIAPHSCPDIDCFHGMTLDEACEQVAQWYDEQARLYRNKEHYIVRYYEDE